jgi:tetratricopeptide (TPR) repeat protein
MANQPEDAEPSPAAPRRKSGRLRTLIPIILGISVLAGGLGWWFLSPPEPAPPEKLKLALRLLDDGQYDRARSVAEKLHADEYRDPDFSGGAVYVLGMTSFYQAASRDAQSREQAYVVASGFLREADHLSVTPERRPVWAWALGVSLYSSGVLEDAIPLLEETVKTYPPGRLEAGMMLLEAYLDHRTPEHLDQALALSAKLLGEPELTPDRAVRVRLYRAQAFLAKGNQTEADQLLAQVQTDATGSRAAAVLRAQTLLDEHKSADAIALLSPLAVDERLDQRLAAQAQFLMGQASLSAGKLEDAIGYFEKTADRFEGTHEAFASRVLAADALRKLGRKEEALEAFGMVLRSIHRPSRYRNRWLTLPRVQGLIRDAWKGWIDTKSFPEAIALAEMMPPTIPIDEAHELTAKAALQWAEETRDSLDGATVREQESRQEELLRRYHDAGKFYARLAESRRTSQLFAGAMWTSAECYFTAKEYEAALARLDPLIASAASTVIARARVRRAQCLANLGRQDEALQEFETVVRQHGSDPAAFTAQYAIGAVQLELNRMSEAETAWRKVVESQDLRPEALEWRQSLGSLSKLLYDTSDMGLRTLEREFRANGDAEKYMEGLAGLDRKFAEAVLRLDEYLERYPSAEDRTAMRFHLARALQGRSRYPTERLSRAETEAARIEYRQQVDGLLSRAERGFQRCEEDLTRLEEQGRLDATGREMLRNAYFERAGCLYGLEQYEKAIEAYTICAAKYQQDANTLGAYVQIANCYTRLKKRAEALSTLAQAQLLLKQLPDSVFVDKPGRMTRVEWEKWLTWASQKYQ